MICKQTNEPRPSGECGPVVLVQWRRWSAAVVDRLSVGRGQSDFCPQLFSPFRTRLAHLPPFGEQLLRSHQRRPHRSMITAVVFLLTTACLLLLLSHDQSTTTAMSTPRILITGANSGIGPARTMSIWDRGVLEGSEGG